MGMEQTALAGDTPKLVLPGKGPMELAKGIEFKAGRVQGMIFGGPYIEFVPGTRRLRGVKMAEEIKHPHDISIPTRDFGVPSKKAMLAGMLDAVEALANGEDIYVGCKGGRGRTGLFMALMKKVELEYRSHTKYLNPVIAVRSEYNAHAVETEEQEKYVAEFDVSPVVNRLRVLNGQMVAKPTTPGGLALTITFLKAVAVFLPALIQFLSYVQKRFDKRR